MSTGNVDVFNELLFDFVNNLAKTYSTEASIVSAPAKLKLLIASDVNRPHMEFMAAITPHVADIHDRNDTFFVEKYKLIPGLNAINFGTLWNKSPKETQSAIWDYMYNLLLLGGSLQSIPDNLMSDITDFVSQYEQSTDGSKELDVEHLIGALRTDTNLSHLFRN